MADRLHLQPRHRRMLESLLREHLPEVEVWAYGSRVTGRSHHGSDLDLVLRGPGLGKIPVGQLADFEEALRESNIPFLVEARDWARLPERFHAEIHSRHVVFVGAPGPIAKWRTVRLGDHIDSCLGKMLDKKKNRGELLPYLGNKNVRWGSFDITNLAQMRFEDHEHDRYGLEHGDLVVCEGGEPGRCAIWRGEVPRMKIQKALHRIRTKEQLDSRYLHYWFLLSGRHRTLEPYFTGTTIKHLTAVSLSDLQIRLPPKREQEAIAHILGTLDDKIELSRRINETLEAMARALFKSWFVEFEPVRAKVDGAEVRLPHDVSRLFPDSYDESVLGNVPRGWKVVELTELIDVNPRRPSLRKGESAPYVPMSSMPTSGHTPSRVSHRPFGSGTRFINGDTLVARITPCLENGKTAYVDFLKEGQVGWGSTEYIILRPKPFLPSEFAYCLARSLGFREFAIQSMTGTSGRQRVQPAALGQFLMPHPPERIGKEFGRLIRPMIQRALLSANESRALAELRDTLLPKLISGEIRIADAEKAVESVA
ncbi:MAG: restriction endonuclease subunit S [Gammaproteobacteria bacterium]|nr:restriction endonuclease subunit S [Gammaproteobacteria bacterium]